MSLHSWMASLESTVLSRIPLFNLSIPGSHDSGAYFLNTDLGFSVDRPDLKSSWFLNLFSLLTYPLIKRFSITQRLNVHQQLQSGVRYLDLRVAIRPEDNQFYICHNFYGPPLKDVLHQVCAFLQHNSKEVILLDVQHVYNFHSDKDHQRLIDLLVNQFSRVKLIPMKTSIPSLESLWSQGQQVFLFYRPKYEQSLSEFVWPSAYLPNPWPNTRSLIELAHSLVCNTTNRPKDKLFVSQAVLTPNPGYVVCHWFGSLEKSLADKANKFTFQLIARNQFSTSTNDLTIGPNIIMFDFVDWNDFRLVHSIVQLNSVYLKDNSLRNE